MNKTEYKLNSINPVKVFMLGVAPLLLCFSFFMSIFTAFPIGLSSVLYGRKIGFIVAGISLSSFYLLKNYIFELNDFVLILFYTISIMLGLSLSEVVRRGINPIKGIIFIGVILVSVMSGLVYGIVSEQDKTMKNLIIEKIEEFKPALDEERKKIEKSSDKDTFEVQAILANPNLLADEVIKTVPVLFIMGLFLTLWVNVFLLLKSNRIFSTSTVPYSEKYLLNFKMPDHAIWFVIGFFAMFLAGDFYLVDSSLLGTFGKIGLGILGVFYFFQGFGLYLAYLDYFKIYGLFRTMLVVATVLMANNILAVIGLLDMFVNFKKFMKKNEIGE